MTLTKTAYEHIAFNDAGVPVIVGTTMKVLELVLEQRAYGWSPEELRFQHPYLPMGQIHSALAYWDHREALDLEIAERLARVEARRQGNPSNDLVIGFGLKGGIDVAGALHGSSCSAHHQNRLAPARCGCAHGL